MATAEASNAATNNGTQIATSKPKEVRVVQDNGPVAHLMDTARFEHTYRIANAMAQAALIPDHLVGVKRGGQFQPYSQTQIVGNCFLVVNQSLRWGIDPFSAMAETYAVGGKLGFQGKLVAALINARAGLKKRLNYAFKGTGDDLTVTVSGTFEGEDEPRTVTLSVAQGKTDNQMWKKDPEQKLIYSGATKWARRHCPEIMLGVLTDDDLDRITIDSTALPSIPHKPSLDSLTERFAQEADAQGVSAQGATDVAQEAPTDDAHQGDHIEDIDQSEAADPLAELAEAHPLFGLPTMLKAACEAGSLEKINTAEASYTPMGTEPEIVAQAMRLCEAARDFVRSKRGGRSSK